MGTWAWTATASAPTTSPPCRADGGGTHEDAPLCVLDQLDHPFVTHLMDPAASGRGNVGQAHPDPEATLLSLALGEPDGPHLGVGEGDARHGMLDGARPGVAQDGADHDAGLVDRHMG